MRGNTQVRKLWGRVSPLFDLPVVTFLGAALFFCLATLSIVDGFRARNRMLEAHRANEVLEAEVRDLGESLEAKVGMADSSAADLELRELFFAGTTESEGSLALVSAVESSQMRTLEYASSEAEEVSRFEEGVRRRIVRWPVEVTARGTYPDVMDLLDELAVARPAFAVAQLDILVGKNEDGEVIEELEVHASLETLGMTTVQTP